MVGAVRFELTTSCTRNKRASQATLRPEPTPAGEGVRCRVEREIANDFRCGLASFTVVLAVRPANTERKRQ